MKKFAAEFGRECEQLDEQQTIEVVRGIFAFQNKVRSMFIQKTIALFDTVNYHALFETIGFELTTGRSFTHH